jgi:hypothetical protein
LVFDRSATHGIVGPTKSGKEGKVPLTASLEAAFAASGTRADLASFARPSLLASKPANEFLAATTGQHHCFLSCDASDIAAAPRRGRQTAPRNGQT